MDRGDPQLVSRARGALLGLVAGNQLGVPTEHLGTPEAIRAAFSEWRGRSRPTPKNSPYDDDAAMALLLGESLLASKDSTRPRSQKRWVKWMKVDGRGSHHDQARAHIDRPRQGAVRSGRLANQENPGRSAGNGSVMRCIPVALRYHDDLDRLIRVSTQHGRAIGRHRLRAARDVARGRGRAVADAVQFTSSTSIRSARPVRERSSRAQRRCTARSPPSSA